MTRLPASCAWTAAGLRAAMPVGSTSSSLTEPTAGRLGGDRGEGVISAAIAVLIVAFLGALMWVGFQTMWKNTETRTNDQVNQIGKG